MKIVFLILFNLSLLTNLHAASKKTTILFLGDSLTEGLGVNEQEAYPRLVERNLRAKKIDVDVINGGVSGATSASGMTRLKWHLKKKIDIVVLELGANDGLRGLKIADTQKNLTEIVRLAKKSKVKILLLGLLMPPNYGKEYTHDFESMYKNISQSENIPLLPFFLKQIAGKSEFNQADGIHPNAKGHEIIAGSISEFVEKSL